MLQVSVVVPTVGRRSIVRLLDALATQDVGGFEVVVVADANHPDPGRLQAAVADRLYPARALHAAVPGASAARNVGVDAARAPVVLFLDDDVVPRRDLVRRHLAMHALHPAQDIGMVGMVVWSPEIRVSGFMRWVERGVQFDYEGAIGDEAGWERLYTANASVKRDIIHAVGGFDEVRLPYGYEDLDLAKRMHDDHGFRLLLDRDAIVEHLHEMTLDGWRENVARVARAERVFTAKHPEMPPYFHEFFAYAAQRPPADGRGRHLMRFCKQPKGWLGKRAWTSADIWYRQQLAPHFLAAWEGAPEARANGRVAARGTNALRSLRQ